MRGALLRIVTLVRKELLTLLKDPRSRVILFVPAILQSLLFGYAASYDLNHVPYAVFDRIPQRRLERPDRQARRLRGVRSRRQYRAGRRRQDPDRQPAGR